MTRDQIVLVSNAHTRVKKAAADLRDAMMCLEELDTPDLWQEHSKLAGALGTLHQTREHLMFLYQNAPVE